MAHNLNMVNGTASMAYRGSAPWHELGTRVEGVASSVEMMAAAKLDWEVSLEDVLRLTPSGDIKAIKGRKVIVRQGTGAEFGIVSPSYSIIQNAEQFGFFDGIVSAGLAQYETAGALGGGERVWCMASMPGGFTLPGTSDETRPYCMVTSTHDGSGACQISFIAVRVVCQNTLNAAMASGSSRTAWSIRHKGDTASALRTAQTAMQSSQKVFRDYEEAAQRLASRSFTEDSLRTFLKTLIPGDEDGAASSRTQNIRADIRSRIYRGKGNDLPGVRGTWWAALNGVTEYADHARSARGEFCQEKAESRFDSAMFGSGSRMKAEAFSLAMAQ